MELSIPIPKAIPFETGLPKTPLPVIDPRNKPTLNVPQNKYTTFDFTPFLSSPAVLHRMRENRQQIPLLSPIPSTRIPSPLAENLHPSVIKDVRDFLLGTGKYTSPYQRQYSGNGAEVWASWKRAWDIWNNHYIDGRVNEVWVARAYRQWEAYIAQQSKKGKAPFEGPPGRSLLRRKKVEIGKPYHTESKALEQFEVSIDDVAQGRKEFKQRAIDELKASFKRNRDLGHGYIEFCEALAEWTRREWYRPEWSQYKDYKNKAPEYLPLTMKYVHEELYDGTKERVIELLGTEFWQKDPKLEAHPGTIEYAIAIANWEQQAEVIRCRYTERPNWLYMYEPTEKLEDKYIESAKKRTSPAVIDEFRLRMNVNRKLGVGYIELSWQEAHYNINLKAHDGDLDATIQEFEKPDPKDYIDKARPGKLDENTAPVEAIDRDEEEEDQDEDDINHNDLARPAPIEEDGSSGGFFAMRDFLEYAVPDEDDASFHEYYDPIENSIWRPIQVGEQRPKIDMDEEPDSFLKNSQFEIDGGVDCGRSPYPLLRPLYRYAQSHVGAHKDSNPKDHLPFKKQGSLLKLKKYWDNVTGTVFNIPTKNIYAQTLDKIEDANHRESFNNNESYQNPDIFPLDIRRCEKISSPFKPGKNPKKLVDFRETDTIIQPSFRMKEKEYRPMRFDDPWWVEPEQKYYRDMPPRNYPPKFDETQSHLPKDVRLWKEELEKDSDLKKRYFVANLDGRLLTINGVEVGKGEIAGPLPEFAIIQTEGGGVSFWHGVGGRFYLQPAGARMKDWSRQWSQLRQALNDEFFGVASGYFWQNAIVGKIMEDDEGEGEQDPKWIKWKSAKPVRNTNAVDPRAVKLHPGFLDSHPDPQSSENEDWGAPGPLPFESPEAELKWAAAQLHFQEMFVNEPWLKAKMIEPTKDTAWGGLQEDYRDPSDGPTDEARDAWWASNGDRTQKVQVKSGQTFDERLREEFDADQATVEAKSLKRKADNDGYFLPDAKRFRENIGEREKQKIEEIELKEVERLNMGIAELVDQINQGARDLEEKAEPGALVKHIDQWHPASGADAEAQAKEALQRVRELERVRLLYNERRKNANESAIPPFKDPIAGLAPSTVLTLPENQWALEAIVRHREAFRLDQEVQETGALNNLNASERLKRKRLTEKRSRGGLGFTIMTDAQLKEQKRQLVIKAKEQKEEEDFRKVLQLTNAYKAKTTQVKKDEKHVAAVKDGIQAGDIVKAEAAMKKGREEIKDFELEIAKQLSLSSLAEAEGISVEDLVEYAKTPGFDPTNFGAWTSNVARAKREEEILQAAKVAAKTMNMSVEQWYKSEHGVSTSEEYLKKLAKNELPKYELNAEVLKTKQEFIAKILRTVSGHDQKRKGQFTSWEEVISSMPVAADWDTVVNAPPETDTLELGLTPRIQTISIYDGSSIWTGQL
ncbi:103a1c68-8382-4bef-bb96-af23637da001 [Sclerotinia trifoliorum]|uniref:103a1c68-8382-4bef-bb96-af23637da001 n=1 Tax=Sclerotinia trifoliorum TaxID=28548 RepID=A0A8H2W354_9HELO|nr:103a1c68-8382-4bef-bb96-af23637da001 [Sclerotinia trifoliorum]